MLTTNRKASLRSRLLASAATGMIAAHVAMPLAAEPLPAGASSVLIDILNNSFTQLAVSDSLVASIQLGERAIVSAELSGSSLVTDLSDAVSGGASGSLTGSFEVISNTLEVEAIANTATNTISSTTTPALANASAVSNTQANTQRVISALALDNEISAIAFQTTVSGSIAVSVDESSVNVNENTLTTVAKGNTSVNTIEIADGVSVTGSSGAGTMTLVIDGLINSSGGSIMNDLIGDADLIVANAQINEGGLVSGSSPLGTVAGILSGYGSGSSGGLAIVAAARDTNIYASLENATGSTVTVSENTVGVVARGNDVVSTIKTGEGAASIVGSLAIGNLQANRDVTVLAVNVDTNIDLDVEAISFDPLNNTLTVDGNEVSATAYGNNAVQTLSLSANAINGDATAAANIGYADFSGSVSGSGRFFEALTATGMATVSNLQLTTDTQVVAVVDDAYIGITTGSNSSGGSTTKDSSLALTGNTISATAVVARGVTSAVSLTGNDVGTGVAVNNMQASLGLAAATTSGATIIADVTTSDGIDGGILTVSDNKTSALSVLNASATTIAIDANNVVATANNDTVSYGVNGISSGGVADVTGSFIALSTQVAVGVSAADTNGSATLIYIEDDVSGSTVALTGNTTFAAALGNDASTGVALAFNSISVSGSEISGGTAANIGTAMTQQSQSGLVIARADSATTIYVEDDILSSTVANNGNTVEALAIGNRTTANNIAVTATNIDTGDFARAVMVDADSSRAAASFLAIGTQIASGAIVSSLGNGSGINNAIEILTEVDSDIKFSTVTVDANVLRASATGNSAVNGGVLTVAGTSDTTIGVSNRQLVNGPISVEIGIAGVDGADYDGFNLTGEVSGSLFVADATGLTANQLTYLENNLAGYTFNAANNTVAFNDTARTLDFADFVVTGTTFGGTFTSASVAGLSEAQIAFFIAQVGGNFISRVGDILTVSATPGTTSFAMSDPTEAFVGGSFGGIDQRGGVLLIVGNDIEDSTVSVSDNIVEGLVTGNTATNTLVVNANVLLDGANSGDANASDSNDARASNAISSSQDVSGDLTSDVAGRFAVVMDNDSVERSTVTVDGNTQLASVIGNTAKNTLTIDATTMDSTVALNNEQDVSSGSLAATSDLDVFALAGVGSSSLSLTNNTSRAFVRGNVVDTALSVTGVSLAYRDSSNAVLDSDDDVSGSIAAYNSQYTNSNSTYSATAAINVFNSDSNTGFARLSDSTVALSGNRAIADAASNVATVTLELDGTDIASTAALGSEQDNVSDITATATANVVFTFAGVSGSGSLAANSSILVGGNVTTALANANSLTQTLSIIGGNVSGASDVAEAGYDLSNGSGGEASYVVGSAQYISDELDIVANAQNSSYAVSLSRDVSGSVTDSMISVANNTTTAQARGNVLGQSITVDANQSDGATYALYSQQETSGASQIVATAQNIMATISADGAANAVRESTLAVTGNATNAFATGNVATNSMLFDVALFAGGDSTAFADGEDEISGTAILFNAQFNEADVTSVVEDVEYGIGIENVGDVAFQSALSVTGNTTTAQALGNRALNTLTLNTNMMASDSSIGISSNQFNWSEVTATVSNVAGGITVDDVIDANVASTMDVSGNGSLASAMGNTVSNGVVLNAVAVDQSSSADTDTDNRLIAGSIVKSFQENTADVTATTTNVVYGLALNAGGDAMDTSVVTVSGNSIASQAIGNAADNRITVSAMTSSGSYGLANRQSNSGDVVATVSGSFIGITSDGGVSGAMTSLSNNTISATAIGNSATNVLSQ